MYSIRNLRCILSCLLMTCGMGISNVAAQTPAEASKLNFKSMVALGPTGMKTTNDVSLQDELEMDYDIHSLMNDETIRSAVALTDEQLSQIRSEHKAMVDELFTIDVISMPEAERDELKSQFMEKEASLIELLSPQQLAVAQTLRYHRAIAKHGLARVLESKLLGDDLQLNSDQVEKVIATYKKSKQQLNERRVSLLKEANLKLIESLPENRRRQIESMLDKKQYEEILQEVMFADDKPTFRKSLPQVSAVLRSIKKSSVQQDLDLDASQVKQILEAADAVKRSKDSEAQSWTILHDEMGVEQLDKLVSRLVIEQCQIFGTVNALSVGIAAHDMAWQDDEKKEFEESSREIHAKYLAELQKAKLAALVDSFKSLPGTTQDRIRQLIGGESLPVLDSGIHFLSN